MLARLTLALSTLCVTLLAFASESGAETVAVAPDGSFFVTQEYKDRWFERCEFKNPSNHPVDLDDSSWPGFYTISPDSRWLFRIQKTGSGENVGILYRVDANGRVSKCLGFDDALWRASDEISRLKRSELYHTGITSAVWDKTTRLLSISIRGSNNSKSEDGIESTFLYDLKSNVFREKK